MRTVHQATSIVAALALAFGATACGGTDPKPVALPTATTSTTARVSPVPTPAVTRTQAPKTGYERHGVSVVDKSLSDDIDTMRWLQEAYINGHKDTQGVAVAVLTPGGTATITTLNDFQASTGNVIAVKAGPAGKGFCISAYSKAATKAASATQSLVFRSNHGGAQAALGAC